MSKAASDLSGQWSGDYAYDGHVFPMTPFVAQVEEQAGQISGTIIEPHLDDGRTISATLLGIRHGATIDFIKTYEARIEGYDMPIDYVGTIGEDGHVIRGVWSFPYGGGTFEMRRDSLAADELAQEIEAELPEIMPVTASCALPVP